jgi:diaminohydroxyphosphoribosylaminopyrimidine deaminase/5-amino-6-(5-phosphoribosylamino)uracil reductase
MVGAVVVLDGRLVGVGHHARFGGPHAEIEALVDAGDAARGAILYVTLEPCCHHGKTPPCTEAIVAAGVIRVVAAMPDPFPKVAGEGLARLRDAGIGVEVGLEADVARRLNAPYLKRLLTGRPYVTAKWAMTLDGKLATASGNSQWISGPRSRALVHELRGRMDGIVVGIGTALADDPQLTARPTGPRQAVRLVLDSQARLPTSSRLVRSTPDPPVWLAVSENAPTVRRAALTDLGCEILAFAGDGPVPVLSLLDELGRRGMTNILVEGGGRVLGSFLDSGQIDAVEIYIAPIVEGGSHSFAPIRGHGRLMMDEALRLESHQTLSIDGDVLIRGKFVHAWLERGNNTR